MNLEEIRKVVEAVADPVCGKPLADLKAVQSVTEKYGRSACDAGVSREVDGREN